MPIPAWVPLPTTFEGAVLVAVIAAALFAVLRFVFSRRLYHAAGKRLKACFRCRPRLDKFIVLLADLGGDDAASSRRKYLANALTDMGGFRVVAIGKTLGEDPDVGEQTEARLQTIQKAEQLLERDRADVLIWGRYYNDAYQLGFIPRPSANAGAGNTALMPFGGDTLQIPTPLSGRTRDLLEAVLVTSIRPATEESGTYLVDKLLPLVPKIEAYVHESQGLSAKQQRIARHALGLVSARIGEQRAKPADLDRAIIAFRQVLSLTPRRTVPLQWARTQNNLGNALQRLGEREPGTKHLDAAVLAYHEALKEYTRERVPLGWAATQNNLGTALQGLGEREPGTKHLGEAVSAYHEALKEYTRKRVPLYWALTQNNLGTALQALGERESGTKRLEEAVRAYHEALKEYTRERVPLYWAAAQNNLGTALQRLGERESGTKRLEEAVSAYHEALKERTRERVPLDWAMTQNNLGTALQGLGKREPGTKRLEEAMLAFREALKEWTRERVPLHWAGTQNNLGNALVTFSEKLQDVEKAQEAYRCFQAAREVFAAAGDARLNGVEKNMRHASALIEKLQAGN